MASYPTLEDIETREMYHKLAVSRIRQYEELGELGSCRECFEVHVAQPCFRCGEPGEKYVDYEYDNVTNILKESPYWECGDCRRQNWCTSCGKLDPDFDREADFYAGRNGECRNCFIKRDLDKIECKCECGSEGKFYSKDEHKWLCINCIIANK